MIYTIGYGRHSPDELKALCDEETGIAVDIRYYTRGSKARPEWGEENLRRLFGDRYYQIKAFGNKTFGQGDIVIANYSKGLSQLREMIAWKGWNLFLFCACSDHKKCHRDEIARMLTADRIEIMEWEWPREVSPWDDPEEFYTTRLQPVIDKFNEWKAKRDKAFAEGKTLSVAAALKWDRMYREYNYLWDLWERFKRSLDKPQRKGQRTNDSEENGAHRGGRAGKKERKRNNRLNADGNGAYTEIGDDADDYDY